MNVGYVGLGALGSELAKCFMKSHALHVWDLDAAACARFDALGARVAATAADLGRTCDVVLLCLPRSSDVRQVLFGAAGLAEALRPGTLVIDQTSGVPDETRDMAARLAQRGVHMMDAAVSASPHVVASGGATLMASGPDEVFERAQPLLQEITSTIFRCGQSVGDGQAMKMVNNAMNAGCRLATLEVAALGRKAGLSLASITEVLNRGIARNQTTDKMLPAIARGVASTNFALSLMLKDVNQAVELGGRVGSPMPMIGMVRALLQIGLNTKGSTARLEDMVGVAEAMAGTHFVAQDDVGAAPEQRLLEVLEQALWATCWMLSRECLDAGRKYGLSNESMAAVLNRSSGWSVALAEISTANASSMARPLRDAVDLAIRHGAPITIASIAADLAAAAARSP